MSILPAISLAVALALLAGCTEDRSKAIGAVPKQTIDRAEKDVNRALEQGAARSQEER